MITEPGRRANHELLKKIDLVLGPVEEQDVGAVMCALPSDLSYRGPASQTIHDTAGTAFDEWVLDHIFKPKIGDLYAAPGFALKADFIFIGITPNWRTDFDKEPKHLLKLCRKGFEKAEEMGLESIAFPPIASGRYGFPPAKAARFIFDSILEQENTGLERIVIVGPTEQSLAPFIERLEYYENS